MTKVVIDDAMVERAWTVGSGMNGGWWTRDNLRAGLEAALSTPEEPPCRWCKGNHDPEAMCKPYLDAKIIECCQPTEPRVAVSPAMRDAGVSAIAGEGNDQGCHWHDLRLTDIAVVCYRAMESIRRKEQGVCGQAPYGAKAVQCLPWFPRMSGPGAVIPVSDPRRKRRRADDPK